MGPLTSQGVIGRRELASKGLDVISCAASSAVRWPAKPNSRRVTNTIRVRI